MDIEGFCRLTKIDRLEHLVASHCKPWKDANDQERLDGCNGLLLSPNVDHLFNKGLISFSGNGDLLISPQAEKKSLRRLGIETRTKVNVGRFKQRQQTFLEFHRQNVFKKAI